MQNDDFNILNKAVGDLPVAQAPKAVWAAIEKELDSERNRISLEKAIASYKCDVQAPDQWYDIEKKLGEENQQILSRAIKELSEYDANHVSFDRVMIGGAKKLKGRYLFYWSSGIAATILFISSYFLLQMQIFEEEQLSFSEEVITRSMLVAEIIQQPTQHDEVLDFINENCTVLAEKCETPEFNGLLDLYLELGESRQELVIALEQHESQLQLVEYLIRVEKEKAEVGNQLIQILITT